LLAQYAPVDIGDTEREIVLDLFSAKRALFLDSDQGWTNSDCVLVRLCVPCFFGFFLAPGFLLCRDYFAVVRVLFDYSVQHSCACARSCNHYIDFAARFCCVDQL
jgi:hypothetical protein